MALNRNNRLFVIGGSIIVLVIMMLATVDPETQYYIDNVMEDPEDYTGDVHIRGRSWKALWTLKTILSS